MKKIAAIMLAVVIILALVGCDVSTRTYRRYPYRTGGYNATLDGAYDGTYRANTRTRNYGTADVRNYAGGAYNRAGTANPGFGTYGKGTINNGTTRIVPANPTDGTIMDRDNQINNRVVPRSAIKAR